MKPLLLSACLVVVSAVHALAQTAPAPKPEALIAQIEELKTNAEHKGEADRGRIYADIARQFVELANAQFGNGESEKGQNSIQEAVSYAEKSAASAEEKGHKIKDAEITLRETARRIEEVRRSVDVDDQPPLKQATKRLGELRKQLLHRMFGDDKK